jgi:hypothetical protein
MLRKAVIATALALAATIAGAAPAGTAHAAAPAAVEQRCSAWQQVAPNVWAIICLYRQGVLYQPIATVQNYTDRTVAYDTFVYLNGNITQICGGWPTATLAGHTSQQCTNNTWLRSDAVPTSSVTVMVDLAPVVSISAPSF